MIGEDEIIQSLKGCFPDFIGDDAAIIPCSANKNYVVTKDLLVEGVHFRTEYFRPEDLAHKSLHVNLSDLAAMGSTPLYILCGISIPHRLDKYASKFLEYLAVYCNNLEIALIGGDTTLSEDKLLISITAIGLAEKDHIKYRSAAKKSDVICVVGDIGFASMGFSSLENKSIKKSKYISSFLRPKAKIKESIWLAKHACVHSMMDVSDGLYIDLKKLCSASKKGAVINLDSLDQCLEIDISLQVALEGGEDYSLLCSICEDSFSLLSEKFVEEFGYELKGVGHVIDNQQILFQKAGEYIDFSVNPFSHFGEK